MKVLIIGYVWPEPESSAAGLRSWNLIDSFTSFGWDITFASASKGNSYADRLSEKKIRIQSILLNDKSFDEFVRQLQPDFVIFDRFVTEEQFGWRVKENCPSAVRVLDTQDLHFLRHGREDAIRSGMSVAEVAACEFDLETEMALRELGSIHRCDGTLVLSSFERDLLVNRFHISEKKLLLYRFQYDPPLSDLNPPFSERRDFVMIGNYRHRPNQDAITWLRNEIWPLIKKRLPQELSHLRVHCVGAYPTKELMDLSLPGDGFYVLGPVKNQFDTLRNYRLNLAPLRFGAGIKGKISDAWWSGTPTLSTPIGFEGMTELTDNPIWNDLVATNPQEFADRAIELYTNEEKWLRARDMGISILQKDYSKEANFPRLRDYLLKLRTDNSSVGGDIAQKCFEFHLHRSTKYFSKWIEQKTLMQEPIKKA